MRVAYFVQSHRHPVQVQRLLATLRRGSPDAALVVGHCPAGEPLDPAVLAELGVASFSHRERARRGFWSMLEPYFDAIELLARAGASYDWLAYLSGQDYPVRPLAAIEAELASSPYDAYLTWRPMSARSADGRRRQGRVRYRYHYVERPRFAHLLHTLVRLRFNSLQPWFHVHLTYGPRVGVRVRLPPVPAGHTVFIGSQWTTMRRACAERVLDAVRGKDPCSLVAHLRHTICPDEAVAQTVLVNDASWRLCNDNRRFVDMAGSRDGHPRTLTLADCPALVSGGYHFARKLDAAADPAPLDWLDAHLATQRHAPA